MDKIVFVKWKDVYNTGITAIDDQHKKLVDLINQLYYNVYNTLPEKSIQEVLDSLIEYTESHFWFEEDLMKKSAYPSLSIHKKEHDGFVSRIKEFSNKFDKKQPVTFQVVQFLKTWLTDHILETDRAYIPFVINAKRGI